MPKPSTFTLNQSVSSGGAVEITPDCASEKFYIVKKNSGKHESKCGCLSQVCTV